MKATWKTPTGKTITLETEYTGKTSNDLYAIIYRVVMDGKKYSARPVDYKGMRCLELWIGSQKAYTPLPKEHEEKIKAEFEEHKSHMIRIATPEDPQWMKDHEDFANQWYDKNSPFYG